MGKIAAIAVSVYSLTAFGPGRACGAAGQEYWPTWRGPDRTGVSATANPPVTWSESQNTKWKIKLTGDGSNSSPVIWGNKIFFQTAVKTDVQGKPAVSAGSGNSAGRRGPGSSPPSNVYKFNVVCVNRNSGNVLWETTIRQELPHEGHHGDHGFASFSPVTDGELVWAHFGSRGLHCLDMGGHLKWSKDLGRLNTVMSFGEGGSLAVAGQAAVVVMDHEGDSTVYAVNKTTGELLWKQQRDERTSWATPLPLEVNGKMQVVTCATNLTRSYDLESGELIWQCAGLTRNVIPSPVAGFGMVFCTSGYQGSSLQAIELGRTGDLSGTDAVKWHVKEATPYVPCPLLYGDKLYVCSLNQAVVSCYDARTGEPYFFKEKLPEISGVYASGAGGGGRVYFAGRNGVTYVLKHSEDFEVLAVNKLDDIFECSPALVGGELYLKGKENLYCIASDS